MKRPCTRRSSSGWARTWAIARRPSRRRCGSSPRAASSTRLRSSDWLTEPVGGPPQGFFLNAVVAGDTALEPAPLLAACLAIERELGRVRTVRNGPRTIDVDILFHGTQQDRAAGARGAAPTPSRAALRAGAARGDRARASCTPCSGRPRPSCSLSAPIVRRCGVSPRHGRRGDEVPPPRGRGPDRRRQDDGRRAAGEAPRGRDACSRTGRRTRS